MGWQYYAHIMRLEIKELRHFRFAPLRNKARVDVPAFVASSDGSPIRWRFVAATKALATSLNWNNKKLNKLGENLDNATVSMEGITDQGTCCWHVCLCGRPTHVWAADMCARLTCVGGWHVWAADMCGRLTCVGGWEYVQLTCVCSWHVCAADMCVQLTCVCSWHVWAADMFLQLTCAGESVLIGNRSRFTLFILLWFIY